MKALVLSLVLFASNRASAGGGGVGPGVNYVDIVQCQSVDPQETRVQSLTYFLRTENQRLESAQPGLLIEGQNITASVYALKGKIHGVTIAETAPTSVLPADNFYAVGGNLRAIRVVAQENHIFLSMVAGATGNIRVNNLQMNCSVR